MNNKGFTLVELIAIIAILAIVMGIFVVSSTRNLRTVNDEISDTSSEIKSAVDAYINMNYDLNSGYVPSCISIDDLAKSGIIANAKDLGISSFSISNGTGGLVITPRKSGC